ncbi:MAG: alpha/beta hydrolase [Sphingobium sp.]
MSETSQSPIDIVIDKVRRTYGGWRRSTSAEQMRADWDTLFGSDASGAAGEAVNAAGLSLTWVQAPGVGRERLFVYLHGGGYKVGSARSHFDLVARISAASGAAGLILDYTRAPEAQFPAQIGELETLCAWLAEQGHAVDRVAFAGDSAGGNLALAGVLRLREKGLPLPAALVLLSPWTDLTASGESYETRADADPIHQRFMIQNMAGNYLGDADPAQPLASPLHADLAGFPPMLIQVGDRETVLDDARNLAAKAQGAGVPVQLEVWDGMIHVFQQFPDELAEARQAIDHIGAFLRAHLA